MALTIAQLAGAIRRGDGITNPAEPELSILTRMQAVAELQIQQYAPNAPDDVRDEATVRIVAYLYNSPPSGGRQLYDNALSQSGAAGLLDLWRGIQFVTLIPDDTPVILPDGTVTSTAEIAQAILEHNTSTAAHTAIQDEIDTDIDAHNASNAAHPQLEQRAEAGVTAHNAANDAHSDIRAEIAAIDVTTTAELDSRIQDYTGQGSPAGDFDYTKMPTRLIDSLQFRSDIADDFEDKVVDTLYDKTTVVSATAFQTLLNAATNLQYFSTGIKWEAGVYYDFHTDDHTNFFIMGDEVLAVTASAVGARPLRTQRVSNAIQREVADHGIIQDPPNHFYLGRTSDNTMLLGFTNVNIRPYIVETIKRKPVDADNLIGQAVLSVAEPPATVTANAVFFDTTDHHHYIGKAFTTRTFNATFGRSGDDSGYARQIGSDPAFGNVDNPHAQEWLWQFAWDSDEQELIARVESLDDPGATLAFRVGTLGTYTLRKTVGEGASTRRNSFVTGPNRYQYELAVFTDPFQFISGQQSIIVTAAGSISYWEQLADADTVAVSTDATIAGDGDSTPLSVANPFTATDEANLDAAVTKLTGIEDGATADQTAAEIKTAYESNADTNAFTDDDKSKLTALEEGATADLTAAEIKTLYESNADTNAFTDADNTKLSGIESGATADQTASEIKTAYESNADTNVFTDAEKTKLDGITAGATGDLTAAEVKTLYEQNTNTNAFTDADATKLGGIERNATADQNAAEIKTLYESNTDTNAFTDADSTKLTGIEAGATTDQTGAEIKAAYEGEANTNAFTDDEKSKLDALPDQNAQNANGLLGFDGSGNYERTGKDWLDRDAVDARVQAAKGTATPVNTGTASAGTSDSWSPDDHDHGITPGAGGTSRTDQQVNDLADARVQAYTGQATPSSEIALNRLPSNLQVVARNVESGGNKPWPNTNIQISGPVKQSSNFTNSEITNATWSDIALEDGGFLLTPANLLLGFNRTEYNAQPTQADLPDTLRLVYGDENVVGDSMANIPTLTYRATTSDYYVFVATIPRLPAGGSQVRLEHHEPIEFDLTIKDNSIGPDELNIASGNERGNVLTIGPENTLIGAVPAGLREVYSGTTGITVTGGAGNSGLMQTNLDQVVDLDTEGHGLIYAAATFTISGASRAEIGFDTAGADSVDVTGFVSLQQVGRAAVYDGSNNLGEDILVQNIWRSPTQVGQVIHIRIARNAENQLTFTSRIEPTASGTSADTYSVGVVMRIFVIDSGVEVTQDGNSGPSYIYASALPAANGVTEHSIGYVLTGSERGIYVKTETVTPGNTLGLGGLSVDVVASGNRVIVGDRTYYRIAGTGRTLDGRTVPAGGTRGTLPTGVDVYFSYNTHGRNDGRIDFFFADPQTGTHSIVVTVGGDVITVIAIPMSTNMHWTIAVPSLRQVSGLRGGIWALSETGTGSGTSVAHAWRQVGNIGSGMGTTVDFSDTIPVNTTPATAGSATTAARGDHSHGFVDTNTQRPLSDALPINTGTAASGTSGNVSRADHDHGIAVGSGGGATLGDATPVNTATAGPGTATSASREDHDHGIVVPTPGEGSITLYATKAALDASNSSVGAVALVWNDSTHENNGIYVGEATGTIAGVRVTPEIKGTGWVYERTTQNGSIEPSDSPVYAVDLLPSRGVVLFAIGWTGQPTSGTVYARWNPDTGANVDFNLNYNANAFVGLVNNTGWSGIATSGVLAEFQNSLGVIQLFSDAARTTAINIGSSATASWVKEDLGRAFSTDNPVNTASAGPGSAATAARSDHDHGISAGTSVSLSDDTPVNTGTASAGTGTEASRDDHDHGISAGASLSDDTPVNTATASAGTGTEASRDDHDHGIDEFPGFGTGTPENTSTATVGTDTTASRSDHDHGGAGGFKFRSLTQTAYDAISSKDANTLYFITG